VSALWARWLSTLADLPPARRVLEALLAQRCRRHLLRLDHLPAARSQLRALLTLVHRARATPFGRDHDFGRIRTADDFRRLVPLRMAAELARDYPAPTTHEADLLHGQRRAVRTALALALRERPWMRFFDKNLVWQGDEVDDLVRANFPFALRHVVHVGPPGEDARCVLRSRRDVTTLMGASADPDRLECGGSTPLWISSDTRDPKRQRAAALQIDLLTCADSPVAVTDPRLGWRLLVDHGVYFEFVPADRSGDRHPPRLGLDGVRLGIDYEVSLTSPAGAWAQRTGLVVRFERLDPPVVRFVAASRPNDAALRSDAPASTPPPPHRRTAGSPAALPGTFFHTLSSARADRG